MNMKHVLSDLLCLNRSSYAHCNFTEGGIFTTLNIKMAIKKCMNVVYIHI